MWSLSVFCYLLLSILYHSTAAELGIREVRILTPGLLGNDTFTSQWYNGPAYQMAAEEMSKRYQGRLKLSLVFINAPGTSEYVELMSDDLARVYYRQLYATSNDTLNVIINPGFKTDNHLT